MKKFHLHSLFSLFFLIDITAYCQNGLEGVVVEKYYVTGSGDTCSPAINGYLPFGTVTYRIYADMAPVYRFQACYGVKGHDLLIKTSTRFFNYPLADGVSANDIHPATLTQGWAMLDSWLSVGAAALDFRAVLKAQDDDTVPSLALSNKEGYLLNDDPAAGVSLKEKDGMSFLRLQPTVNYYNLEQDLRVFDHRYANEAPGLIRTSDGAWASYGGTVGVQPANKVLIAQLTTDGVLEFELNLQLAVPGGGTENYVARNPGEGEFTHPGLIYSSAPGKKAPEIGLSLEPGRSKNSIKLVASPSDEDGTISEVEFYAGGRPVAKMNMPPFRLELTDVLPTQWYYAVAIDNHGNRTRSIHLSYDGFIKK